MAEHPLLFDLPPPAPTTRSIALKIRDLGKDAALDQAQRRADAARYQEVTCRSALNRVEGMPFSWTLNPYRGCTHGCHYCFARRYQAHLELGPGDHFSSIIFVKTNMPDVLARELDKPAWRRELVAVGTATDPYQPIEGHYRLTRRCLECLLAGRTPVGLVTKGPMVVRDADLLAELGRTCGCTVCLSVPTVHEGAWMALEPGTAHPLQRLRAVRQLRAAGVNAGVLMAPVVPGFTTQCDRLEATVRAIAEHGAAFMGVNLMYLKGGTKDHFLGFVEKEFPQMLEGFRELYRGAYAPPPYVAAVRGMIELLQSKYGLARRASRLAPQGNASRSDDTSEQPAFDWMDPTPSPPGLRDRWPGSLRSRAGPREPGR